jgi:hypothetical protein
MKKITLLLVTLIVVSCKNEVDENVPQGPCGISGRVDYYTQIKPIINSHCARCHVEYKFYDKLNEDCNNGKFQKHVLIDRDMPPAGGMDTCDYIKVKRWFRDGHYN